ncbi:MAG: hypothetical protein E3J82_02915 [Candidatus Thorarchaeota archaeon]|nr:MAG: hypothetical protein E3J82_02915 [Candidatus Thorarchaeota archaeon]
MSTLPEKKEETPEKKEYAVTILRRVEIVTHPRIGEPLEQKRITYVAAGLAPATLTIIVDQYSLELEKKRIRADIERRLMLKAESYRV